MSIEQLEITASLALSEFTIELDETWAADGYVSIFGPSGVGKSTILRLISGFARPDKGRIVFGGEVWCDTATGVFTPPHQRPVGMVFQDGRLFPHLTVEQNLQFADKRSRDVGKRFEASDIISAFDLAALLRRLPNTLSGGERQRVALARTLLTRPKLLLMDEPLSALDRQRKAEILPYLDGLPARFGAPVFYVSHNVQEVVRLAGQTVILNKGKVEAVGPTAETLTAYDVEASEEFSIGAVVEGLLQAHDDDLLLTQVKIGDDAISLPINKRKPIGERVNIRIDARNVAIATERPKGISIRNVVKAKVVALSARPNSPFVVIRLDAGGGELHAQITKASVIDLGLSEGAEVFALIKAASFDV